MKILAIFDYYLPHVGGAEVVYSHVLEGLAKNHDCTLLTLQLADTLAYEEKQKVTIHRVASWGRMLFPFFGVWKAWKLARDSDIIITSFYSSSVLTLVLRVLLRKKVVMIVHEVLGQRWKRLGFSWIRTAFLRLSERIALPSFYQTYVAVSQSTAEHLKDMVPKGRIRVIHNGVDMEMFSSRARNDTMRTELGILLNQKVYMYAGRPGYVKGINTLLGAIPTALEQLPDVVFVLMLSPSPEEKYREVVSFLRKVKHEDRVKIVSPVARNEVPSYFAMADVAVVPSLTEGFGFLAAEFAAMHIPLVASKVDSLPEVISGKVVFADPGNAQSLVQAMLKAHKGEFETLPEKRFSWEDTIVQYEHVLADTIAA